VRFVRRSPWTSSQLKTTTTDDVNALYKSFTINEQAEMKALHQVGKELKEN
jgi:hypothetical protein